GDVLVRSIVDLRTDASLTLAAIVTEDRLPATFDQSCIRVRWRPHVRADVAELLVGFLNSARVRDWLIAIGVQLHLNFSALNRLEVPDPSNELLDALGAIADAERQYRDWADELGSIRRGLFVATSYGEQLPFLVKRHRTEIERLRAA